MNVLIACEFSGLVREAFRRRGHWAVSCDLQPSEIPGEHYQGDVRDILGMGWDMLVGFPECTFLTVSANRWASIAWRLVEREKAIDFFKVLWNSGISKICLENPVGVISSRVTKPSQTIQPWQFGHGEVKRTCLWLRNLPLLRPTEIVEGRDARVWRMPPGPHRKRERSRTFQGVADAMASQWG